MSNEFRRILGYFFSFVAAFSVLFAFLIGPTKDPRPSYAKADVGVHQCEGDIQKVASDIADRDKPQARQFDPQTGTEYLRYSKRLVTVSKEGPTNCQIRVESLDRVNDGGLIWLGPGFSPSSPSGSTGGSSGSGGSGGGVK